MTRSDRLRDRPQALVRDPFGERECDDPVEEFLFWRIARHVPYGTLLVMDERITGLSTLRPSWFVAGKRPEFASRVLAVSDEMQVS